MAATGEPSRTCEVFVGPQRGTALALGAEITLTWDLAADVQKLQSGGMQRVVVQYQQQGT